MSKLLTKFITLLLIIVLSISIIPDALSFEPDMTNYSNSTENGFYNKYVKADDFLQYTEEQEQEDTTDASESADFENLDLGEYEKWKIRESVPMHEKDNDFRRQRYKELLGVEEPNRNFPGQGSAENKRMDSLMKTIQVTLRKDDNPAHDIHTRFTVNKVIADRVKHAMDEIYRLNVLHFPDYPDGSAGYNYRAIAKTNTTSNHAFGMAIDLSPKKNPFPFKYDYFSKGPIDSHKDSKIYIRTLNHPVVKIMDKHGFGWGGTYGDTMHFSYVYGE